MPGKRDIPFMPSNLETIDYALFEYLDEKLNIHAQSNVGWKKVPVIWVSAERAFHAKNKGDLRDGLGTFKLPVMTIERNSVVKDLTKKGAVYGAIPAINDEKGGTLEITRLIQQYKTSQFQKSRAQYIKGQRNWRFRGEPNEKIVYETISIPIPVFIEIKYTINIKTEYQQQINDILSPFITRTGGVNYFTIEKDGHTYDAFIDDDFNLESTVSEISEEERMYQSNVSIRVLGHIIGDDKNQEQPKIVVRENPVQIRFMRERVMVGDIPEHIDRDGNDVDTPGNEAAVDGKYRS